MKWWQIALSLWPFGLLLAWSLTAAAKRGDAKAQRAYRPPRVRMERAMQQDTAARIYRCLSSPRVPLCDGDDCTTFAEIDGLRWEPTFELFLERNRLITYERELRAEPAR
jgi:hypothetical protein